MGFDEITRNTPDGKKALKVRLYSSECTMNLAYIRRIEAALNSLGIEYTFERITDEKELEKQGLDVLCSFGYCPGCRANFESARAYCHDIRTTPALEINGEIVFFGYQADDAELEKIFSEYK